MATQWKKQQAAYLAWAAKSIKTMDQENGDRGKFRVVQGSALWQEMILK